MLALMRDLPLCCADRESAPLPKGPKLSIQHKNTPFTGLIGPVWHTALKNDDSYKPLISLQLLSFQAQAPGFGLPCNLLTPLLQHPPCAMVPGRTPLIITVPGMHIAAYD